MLAIYILIFLGGNQKGLSDHLTQSPHFARELRMLHGFP